MHTDSSWIETDGCTGCPGRCTRRALCRRRTPTPERRQAEGARGRRREDGEDGEGGGQMDTELRQVVCAWVGPLPGAGGRSKHRPSTDHEYSSTSNVIDELPSLPRETCAPGIKSTNSNVPRWGELRRSGGATIDVRRPANPLPNSDKQKPTNLVRWLWWLDRYVGLRTEVQTAAQPGPGTAFSR